MQKYTFSVEKKNIFISLLVIEKKRRYLLYDNENIILLINNKFQ
jgi:hypothetical protein